MKRALLSLWVSYVAIAFIYMDLDVFNWSSAMRFGLLGGAFVVWLWDEIMMDRKEDEDLRRQRITPTLEDE